MLHRAGALPFMVRSYPAIALLSLAMSLGASAQFAPAVTALAGTTLRQRAAVDMDGDGDLDLVLLLAEGDVVVLENTDGLGAFAPAIVAFDGNEDCWSFHVADIDNDGAPDLVVKDEGDLDWARNEGAGNWSDRNAIADLSDSVTNVLVADITGDGLADVIYIDENPDQPGFAVMANLGGSFTEPMFTADPVDGLTGVVLAAADLDLVGGTDLLVRSAFGDLFILRNTAGDATTWSPALLLPAGIYTYSAPQLIDVDGDGDMDLAEAAQGAVHWAMNEVGEGGDWNIFTEQVLEEVWTAGQGVFGAVGCEGVSLLYIPANPFLPARWSSWLGNLGTFGYRTDLTNLPRGSAPMLADLNGDGRNDLLIERNGDLVWHPSAAVPTTTDLLLPELEPHCVFGAPLPLPPAEPAGGRWSGTWVDMDILYRTNLATTTNLPLAHTYYEPTGCPVAEVDTLVLLNGPRTFPEVPNVLCSAEGPYLMTSFPANTTWFGLAEDNLLDPAQFSGGVVACEMVDPSGASCASLLGPFEVWNSLPATIAPAGPFCIDAGLQVITAQAAPPTGGVWSGDITSSSPFQAVFDPSQGPGFYSVVLRSDPVGPQQCANSDTLVIMVTDDHPVVTLPNETIFCQNTTPFTLEASPAGGVWTGAGVVNGELVPALMAIGNNDLTYTATSTSGCSTVATWSIEVYDRASVEWTAEDLVFCKTDASIVLLATPQGGTWSAPVWTDGEFDPGTVPAGSYPVVYAWTGPNACLLSSDTVMLEVLPDLVVSTAPEVFVCVQSTEAQLEASHPGTWSGSLVGEGQVLEFSPAALGIGEWPVTVTAVMDGFCPGSASTIVIVDICSGVDRPSDRIPVLAPNPFSTGLEVRLEDDDILQVAVLDGCGRLVHQQRPGTSRTWIDLSDVASGYYLIQVTSPRGVTAHRVVKQ